MVGVITKFLPDISKVLELTGGIYILLGHNDRCYHTIGLV